MLAEELSASGGPIRTDARGDFELSGLREGIYEIEASDPTTLASISSGPVAAGERGLTLRVPADAVHPFVRGHVVALDGSPLGGIAVRVVVARRRSTGMQTTEGVATSTDPLGAFAFRDVPSRNLSLYCMGTRVVEELFPLPTEFDPLNVELRLARKIAVRIEARSEIARRAETLRIEDEGGRLRFIHIPGGFGGAELPLEIATASVVSVGEDSRAVVLFSSGKEILRVRLRLEGPEPVRIDL